jgi:hypothetical protein
VARRREDYLPNRTSVSTSAPTPQASSLTRTEESIFGSQAPAAPMAETPAESSSAERKPSGIAGVDILTSPDAQSILVYSNTNTPVVGGEPAPAQKDMAPSTGNPSKDIEAASKQKEELKISDIPSGQVKITDGKNPPVLTATTPPAPPAQSETGVAEALAFGLTESLIKAFPELQGVYDLFVAGKFADARLRYYATNYYKNLGETASSRQANKASRPGVYAQEFDAWKQNQKLRLTQKGITVTPDIEAMLEASYLAGDTDLQLDLKVVNSGKVGTIAGTTLGQISALKARAYDQGVDTLLGSDYWSKVNEGLLTGSTTAADVEEYIKQTAMSAYPAYAKGIEAGRTFNLQTSALRQTIATTLEIDPNSIRNDNPVFKQLIGYVNPTTKQPEQIPLWEAEKMVKRRDEWMYTENARNTFDSLARSVLKDMGVAY